MVQVQTPPPPRRSKRFKPRDLPKTKGAWLRYLDNRLHVDDAQSLCEYLGLDTENAVLAPDYVRVLRNYVEDDFGDDNAVIVFPAQRMRYHTHLGLFVLVYIAFTLAVIGTTLGVLNAHDTGSYRETPVVATTTTTVVSATTTTRAPVTTTTVAPTTTVPATTTTTVWPCVNGAHVTPSGHPIVIGPGGFCIDEASGLPWRG